MPTTVSPRPTPDLQNGSMMCGTSTHKSTGGPAPVTRDKSGKINKCHGVYCRTPFSTSQQVGSPRWAHQTLDWTLSHIKSVCIC
ncbi:unnamed protein product [Victoria cruziana]